MAVETKSPVSFELTGLVNNTFCFRPTFQQTSQIQLALNYAATRDCIPLKGVGG